MNDYYHCCLDSNDVVVEEMGMKRSVCVCVCACANVDVCVGVRFGVCLERVLCWGGGFLCFPELNVSTCMLAFHHLFPGHSIHLSVSSLVEFRFSVPRGSS